MSSSLPFLSLLHYQVPKSDANEIFRYNNKLTHVLETSLISNKQHMLNTVDFTITFDPSLRRTEVILPPPQSSPLKRIEAAKSPPSQPASRVGSSNMLQPPGEEFFTLRPFSASILTEYEEAAIQRDSVRNTGRQQLSAHFLRRSIKTKNSLQRDFKRILFESKSAAASSLGSASIPSLPRVVASQGGNSQGSLAASQSSNSELVKCEPAAVPQQSESVQSILRALVMRAPTECTSASLPDKSAQRTCIQAVTLPSAFYADARPPSRGPVAKYREKLHQQISAALPSELLDESPSALETATEMLPENIMIPSPTRNPERAYSPEGLSEIIRTTTTTKFVSPMAYVRRLQQQTTLEAPTRCGFDLQGKMHLRPQSVDVLNGHRTRAPAGEHVVHLTPTNETELARDRVKKARAFLQTYRSAMSNSSTMMSTNPSPMKHNTAATQPQSTNNNVLGFRKGIVKSIHNS